MFTLWWKNWDWNGTGDLSHQPVCSHWQWVLFSGGEGYSTAQQPQQWMYTSSSDSTSD